MCQPPRVLPLQFIVTIQALATIGGSSSGLWKLMFGSATRLTAGICEASVMMTSAIAPPPLRPACFPAESSGLFVPERCDTGWQNSALWLV